MTVTIYSLIPFDVPPYCKHRCHLMLWQLSCKWAKFSTGVNTCNLAQARHDMYSCCHRDGVHSVKLGMCQVYTFLASVYSSALLSNSLLLSSWMWSTKSKRRKEWKKGSIDKKFATKHNIQVCSSEGIFLSSGSEVRTAQLSVLRSEKRQGPSKRAVCWVKEAGTGMMTQAEKQACHSGKGA